MTQRVVKLPDIGEGTTEAEIVSWLVKPGDVVQEEDPLAEVMTDKATVEIPSPVGGTVVSINGKIGEKLAVGSELVVLEIGGTDAASPPAPRSVPTPHPPAAAQPVPPLPLAGEGNNGASPPATVIPTIPSRAPRSPRPLAGEGGARSAMGEGNPARPSGLSGGKPLASPAVRQQAWDHGIELQFVPGTGPAGRITHADLDAFIAAGARPPAAPARGKREGVEDIPVIGLRRAIAEHLQETWRRVPHFAYIEEIDVTALEELRAHLNVMHPDRSHLTLLPFLMRAIINAVVDYPQVNARYDDATGVLHRHRAVHIGIATQTDSGLTVPVVRHAEALDLWQAAAEIQRLSEAARSGKATREELTGSTITITSLGRLGGLAATPVINAPEVAIVGVNRIDQRPVVRGGQVVVRQMMNLSSSFDHRIVDGWDAASFIAAVKGYLEQPATLFLA